MRIKYFRICIITILLCLSIVNITLFLHVTNQNYNNYPVSLVSDIKQDTEIVSSGITKIEEGNFSGTGNILSGIKFAQIQGMESNIIANSTFVIDTLGWNGTGISLNITNINIGEVSTIGETDILRTRTLSPVPSYVVQPFQLACGSGYLNKISIFLRLVRFSDSPVEDLRVDIWNATNLADPEPDSLLYSEEFNIGSGDPVDYDDWVQLNLSSPLLLQQTETINSTFFVSLTSIGISSLEWWGARDTGVGSDLDDEFSVFVFDGLSWLHLPFDLTLNTSLSPQGYVSGVNLKINNTTVTDTGNRTGIWSYYFLEPENGTIYLNITANQSAIISLYWDLNIINRQTFNTAFLASSMWDYSKWNTSQTVEFVPNAFNGGINLSIPLWNVENVRYNGLLFGDWKSSIESGGQTISIWNAANGTWTIECNSTNYVKEVYVKRGGLNVLTVNATDMVDIYADFNDYMIGGQANLTVFPVFDANYTDSVGLITGNSSIQFSTWKINKTARDNPGIFKLQVIWFNGTEVGINITNLNVQSIPTKISHISHSNLVNSGDSVFVYVNYSNIYTNDSIFDATLLVKNSTDNTTWPAPFSIISVDPNGTYSIEILTLGVGKGIHYFSINLSKPLFKSSEIWGLSFTITGATSRISVTAPRCKGLVPINATYAVTNPIPYHNDSVKVTLFYFDNTTSAPLSNAVITGTWVGGGPAISWVPAFFGYYNITIDVTGFKSNTNHTLKITAQQAGYEAAIFHVIIPIKKLPTRVVHLETAYFNYLEESITIYAVFEDTLNDESISTLYDLNGNFTIKVGNLIDNMSLLAPYLGLYKYDLALSKAGLLEGITYNITLAAFSSEHELALENVSLYVIPKKEVELKLIGTPNYVFAGANFRVHANLTHKDGTPLREVPVTFRVRFENPGSIETQNIELTNGSGIAELMIFANPAFRGLRVSVEYLGNVTVQNMTVFSPTIPILILNSSLSLNPISGEVIEGEIIEFSAILRINGSIVQGEPIIFEFSFDGSSQKTIKTGITDSAGIATVSLKIPSGVSSISVTAKYDGLVYVNGDSSDLEVSVISRMQQFWRNSPYWLAPVGAAIGATITYKYGYRRRKLRNLQIKWKESLVKYQDISNLDYLMILKKNTGISVYNYSFKAEELDYQLMSGFLTAISTFQRELGIKEKKKQLETGEWEIIYEDFIIFGISREFVQFILILDGKISDSLKQKYLKFAMDVERRYNPEFMRFKGNISVFKSIDTITEQYFDKSIMLPHICIDISNGQLKQLGDLERKIYNLGSHVTNDQGFFYVSKLIKDAAEMLGEDQAHVMDVIYSLVKKGYFTSSRAIILLD